MTIETEVAALTLATTNLLTAVNVAKATLDNSVALADADAATATAQAAAAVVTTTNVQSLFNRLYLGA